MKSMCNIAGLYFEDFYAYFCRWLKRLDLPTRARKSGGGWLSVVNLFAGYCQNNYYDKLLLQRIQI